MLKRKSSVSVVPKVLWVFDMRINRSSVKPRRLGLGEETLWVLLLSGVSVLPRPCLETRRHQVGVQNAVLLQKAHNAKWAELVIT